MSAYTDEKTKVGKDRKMQNKGYSTAEKHMEALLDFLDRLLYAAFMKKKELDDENLSMRGLVITEKEIEQAFGLRKYHTRLSREDRELLAHLGSEIREREERTEVFLPFFALCSYFSLTDVECLAFLLAAAPCFHRKYERIYGFLQDRVDMRIPTRGLCISLAEFLGADQKEEEEDFLEGRGSLEILLKNPEKRTLGLGGGFCLRPRVRNFLQNIREPEEEIRRNLTYYDGQESLLIMQIRAERLQQLNLLFDEAEQFREEIPSMILLWGSRGIGKHFLMKKLAEYRRLRLLFFDVSEILYEAPESALEKMESLLLESLLFRACICVEGGDLPAAEGGESSQPRKDCRRAILKYLGENTPYFVWLAEEKEEQLSDFQGKKICMELPALTAGEKICLWKAFGAEYELDEDMDAEQNGNKYILTPGGIRDVLNTAQLEASLEGAEKISQKHIRKAVRQNQKNQLGSYASRIDSSFVWEDLILGEEQKRQMRMVCDQMKYRDIVGERWGFHKKTPYGRGLSVLFYGPPGTGKTMAAQVMANELGLDLYRIDISQMISKYIGETQKNITQLFQKAKDINALLFFDEADSLFAKRSEAKDSHDRNANAETAHLLQKLEDYEGITILATNYLNNIDDAFKRRIKFIIHIAFPEKDVRLRLWRSMLPPEAECEEELDFEFFADRFELSGSSIKEIMTNGAYLAAAQRRGLMNRDLVEAVRLNYAKYGKILTKNDFGYLG